MGLKNPIDLPAACLITQRCVAALVAAMFCATVTAGGVGDDCPERCGEVLKACLEKNANRYLCIDVTEKCVVECKAGKSQGKPFTSVDCRLQKRVGAG